MADKREGFGSTQPLRPEHGSIKQVFETPHYRVVVVKLSTGPADQPEEMRIRYVVLSKDDPVIAAHSGLKGEAIALCLAGEENLQRATQLAVEQAARNYKPQDNPDGPFGGFGRSGGGAPNLG